MKRILLAALALMPCAAWAHVVPDDVRVRTFLKPQDGHMTILVRMPANALIDILFPVIPGSVSLDLKQIDGFAAAGAQVWIADLVSVYEDGRLLPTPRVLAAKISPVSDLSFNSFQDALKHVQGDRLPPDTLLPQDEAAVDALLEMPIRSVDSDFSIEPRFGRVGVRVTTTLTFLPAGGGARQYVYDGDPEPFQLNPAVSQAGARFMKAGLVEGLTQTDDLLFLFCLALVFRRFRALTPFLAAFAACQIAGSVYCAAGLAPLTPDFAAWITTLVAAAIVYMGIEAIVAPESGERRWLFAVASGLVFGAGCWAALGPIVQFGGMHRLVSLLAFNLGLILTQAGVLAFICAALPFGLRFTRAWRTALVIAAAIAIRISWHRMIERAQTLGAVTVNAPLTGSTLLLPGILSAAAIGTIVAWMRRTQAHG
jgi:hypothetical protein